MTLIAIEEHWMLPALTSALASLPPEAQDESLLLNDLGDTRRHLEDLGEGRLAAMDALGIDLSILSLTPPGTQALGPTEAVQLSRTANEVVAGAVADHPARLRALASLPMSSPPDAAGELERARDLGHVGAMVYGRSGHLALDDPAHDPFFAAAARLRMPVFIHPQLPPPALREASYRGFDTLTELGLATFGWGWHLEAATAALRLILRGTFDRHPELQIVLGHWGEMLLFWLDRADSLARVAKLPHSVSDYVRRNVHITNSGMLNPTLLAHTLAVTTPDRLLFSTDHPFGHVDRDGLAALVAHLPDDEAREKFAWRNAAALFDLDL